MNARIESLVEKNICDKCGEPCDDIYENADGEYECLNCHTACPPEDD